MITLRDLLNNTEIQSAAKYFYYDYDKEERIELSEEEAGDYDIKYIYEEDGIICFEVDKES